MGTTIAILLAISLFLVVTYLYWKITEPYVLKIYGKKMYKSWTSRTFYWSSVLFVSGGITVFILLLLKTLHLL